VNHHTGAASVFNIEQLCFDREKNGFHFHLQLLKLSISKGDFVAVVGDSGCGKSTLLDILGLILPPSSVERFEMTPDEDGPTLDLRLMPARRLARIRRQHLGYVLQGGGLLPFLNVAENIKLAQLLRGGNSEDLPLSAFGISAQAAKKPQHLSGGQRQRVAIARALAGNPEVVLADEPTAAVDKPTARHLCEVLSTHAKKNRTTVIMVTHDHALLDGIANRRLTFSLTTSSDGSRVNTHVHEVAI